MEDNEKAAETSGGYPEIPNEETLEAFREIEEMKKHPELYKGYTDVEEMMRDILGDEDTNKETPESFLTI